MTTTHIYADGTVEPELPPLPIGALAQAAARKSEALRLRCGERCPVCGKPLWRCNCGY